MSKAVLVMDMPDDCTMCKFWNAEDDECYATGSEELSLGDCEEIKPDWCPLRELPKYKRTIGTVYEGKKLLLNAGWNDCLDEILKTDGLRKE